MTVLSSAFFVLAILRKYDIYSTICIGLIVFRRCMMFTFDVRSIMKMEP